MHVLFWKHACEEDSSAAAHVTTFLRPREGRIRFSRSSSLSPSSSPSSPSSTSPAGDRLERREGGEEHFLGGIKEKAPLRKKSPAPSLLPAVNVVLT